MQEGWQQPRQSRRGLLIALSVILGVFLLSVGGVAGYFLVWKRVENPEPTPPAASPSVTTPQRATPSPTGLAGGPAYTSPLGFSVVIPQGWSTKLEGNVETFANGAEDERFAVVQVVSHGKKEIEPDSFLSELVRKAQNEQGYRVEQDPQKVTFASIPATRVRFGFQRNGYQVLVETYAFKTTDGRLFQVQYAGSVEYFPSHLQDFSQFDSTFRVVDTARDPSASDTSRASGHDSRLGD